MRVVGLSYSQTQRPKVKYDDLRAVCFKLRVAFICSGINGFCNIHIESKTGKNKRFSKTKNDKLPNAQREGRCLTLALCVRELIIFRFAKPLIFLGFAPYVNIAKTVYI